MRSAEFNKPGRVSSVPKAGATGLEPATSAVTGQRSNQLSYAPSLRVGGRWGAPSAVVSMPTLAIL